METKWNKQKASSCDSQRVLEAGEIAKFYRENLAAIRQAIDSTIAEVRQAGTFDILKRAAKRQEHGAVKGRSLY